MREVPEDGRCTECGAILEDSAIDCSKVCLECGLLYGEEGGQQDELDGCNWD